MYESGKKEQVESENKKQEKQPTANEKIEIGLQEIMRLYGDEDEEDESFDEESSKDSGEAVEDTTGSDESDLQEDISFLSGNPTMDLEDGENAITLRARTVEKNLIELSDDEGMKERRKGETKDADDGIFEELDEQAQQRLFTWRKNVPYLYDICLTYCLDWPALSLDWSPIIQKFDSSVLSLFFVFSASKSVVVKSQHFFLELTLTKKAQI
jgi:hypothetical protein